MSGLTLRNIVSRDNPKFIDRGFRFRGKSLANGFNVAHGLQESLRLIEIGKLLYFRSLVCGRDGIEVIRDEVQRNAGFVVLVVKKIFEVVRVRCHG